MGRRTRGQKWAEEIIEQFIIDLDGVYEGGTGFSISSNKLSGPQQVLDIIKYSKKMMAIGEEADKMAKGKSRKKWQEALDLLLMHEEMGV